MLGFTLINSLIFNVIVLPTQSIVHPTSNDFIFIVTCIFNMNVCLALHSVYTSVSGPWYLHAPHPTLPCIYQLCNDSLSLFLSLSVYMCACSWFLSACTCIPPRLQNLNFTLTFNFIKIGRGPLDMTIMLTLYTSLHVFLTWYLYTYKSLLVEFLSLCLYHINMLSSIHLFTAW